MKKIFFGLLIVCFGRGIFAQEKLTLTLEDAKKHAVTYNRELRKAGISIDMAQAKLWETISSGLPQVNGTVDYTNYLGFKMNFGGQSIPFNPTSTAQLSVGQLLFGGAYWVGIEMAKLSKKLSEKNVVKTELDVKEGVAVTFNSILVAEQAKQIILKNKENLSDIFKKTENLANVGIIERNDVEQLSVQLLNTEAAIRTVEQQIEMAYNMLRLQLGASADTEIQLIGNIESEAENMNPKLLSDEKFDPENNIDYQLLKDQEKLLERQVTMGKAGYLPTVTGFYSYTYKIKKPAFDMSPANVIGFRADIPIFSSFQKRAQIKQSKLNLRSIGIDVEQISDQLNIRARQLRYNLQNAYEQYEIQKKNVEVSRKVFESSRQKQEQGMLSALDLTVSNNNYLQAENNLLSAVSELLKAQVELMKLSGTL